MVHAGERPRVGSCHHTGCLCGCSVLFGLDGEAVLYAEHEVAGEGVGVGDCASGGSDGLADV